MASKVMKEKKKLELVSLGNKKKQKFMQKKQEEEI